MAFTAGALVFSSLGATAAQRPPAPAKDPPRLTVRGRDILAPDGRPIRLRGFNLLWWAPPTAQDAADVQELGANCVRYMFGYQPKGRFEPEQLDYLERQVRLFTRRGLWVIPNVHAFERKEGETRQGPWDSPELHREFLDLWTHVLTRLRDEPFIAAWEPLTEPHDVKDERLREWHAEVIAHIRKLDPRTPIVVDANGYANHLYRIERVVPDKAVGELKKVVLWLEHDNPKGRHAHYHPSVEWLKANGYNPDKAKGVEFGSARSFLNGVRHQPWMVLHELAHSYHDRVLGFDHPKVKEAYEAAKQSGKYEKVLIWNGHVGRHYAMTDCKEYFAENTEAFFGTNDIYPFVKAELKQHDPTMYVLLAELWGIKEGSGGSK